MKSLSKLGKTIMKVANINLNFRKMKNNDKKAATPPSRHTSTLKAVPLAVLMALNTGTLATDATCKPNENNLTVTTEVVSNTKSLQQTKETISPEDKKDYDKLYSMMFGVTKGGQTNLKKTDKVLVCHVKDVCDYNTGKRLGDAIIIQYKHPENKKEYDRLKNAGLKPEAANYPVEEIYLLPVDVFTGNMRFTKNNSKEKMGVERCANIKTDFNCFKWEIYPEPLCDIYAGSFISYKDSERYFNYNKDGWHSFHNGDDRCGMTKNVSVSYDEASMILNYLNNNYPKK